VSSIQLASRNSAAIATTTIEKSAEEHRLETERMRDVVILLESLARREEQTVKLILDCLYDVGSVNLINQRIRRRPLNRLLKWMTRFTKPIFRQFAWHWFRKNCPQLIADWLHSQVVFDQTTPDEEDDVVTTQAQP
jgi:hypothetical protein